MGNQSHVNRFNRFRVYKTGVASTQKAYDGHVYPLFKSLDRLEAILASSKYLLGDNLTEADIRLYVTIIRFDPVYHQLFKCNIGMIRYEYLPFLCYVILTKVIPISIVG